MKYPVFASFIILVLVIRHAIRRNRRIGEESDKLFWEKEREANEVRRKPLDDLVFIKPDTSAFPLDVMADDEEIAEYRQIVEGLANEKIVNLTGLSNTELKMHYGAANLPLLTEYDDRYTTLVTTLQKWADRLWENGYTREAVPILEEQIRIRADITSAYRKLASFYKNEGTPEKIGELRKTAETLNSSSKNVILRSLEEYEDL